MKRGNTDFQATEELMGHATMEMTMRLDRQVYGNLTATEEGAEAK